MISITDPADGTRWRFDEAFLGSNWSCVWGRGCVGIGDEPAEHLGHGCCSVGAQMLDQEEAMTITALAATLDPGRFQFHAEAASQGVLDVERGNTRVVDGACVFLNRPGFSGGAGCALHLAAIADGESPIEWKPSICWQLPIKVDQEPDGTRTLRRWHRHDWGPEGEAMAWLCTDPAEGSYVGEQTVVADLEDELVALVGRPVYVELRAALEGPGRVEGAGR